MGNAKRDDNLVPTLLGVSSVDGVTPIPVYVDPVTHRVLASVVGGNFADAEVPSGAINGSNTAFTLAHSPSPAASLILVINGTVKKAGGEDYTLSGTGITTVAAPPTGSIILAWYRY